MMADIGMNTTKNRSKPGDRNVASVGVIIVPCQLLWWQFFRTFLLFKHMYSIGLERICFFMCVTRGVVMSVSTSSGCLLRHVESGWLMLAR